VLRERVIAYVTSAVDQPPGTAGTGAAGGPDALAERLAGAARAALTAASAQSGGRAAALDLLAADALVTLALLRQAEEEPAMLQAFAARLLELEFTAA